ncbi:MAG: hypothetical protein H0U88_08045 [Chthoniobacterales bacterium]|nr:hypothetical protein [Chthoniobacterales bacterium]
MTWPVTTQGQVEARNTGVLRNFCRQLRKRFKVILLGLLLATAMSSWVFRLTGPIDLRADAGVYFILGSSIAQGKGYRLLHEPGEIRATQYPPLMPILVAVHQVMLGSNDPALVGYALRLTALFTYLAFTTATYIAVRQLLPTMAALAVVLLTLLSFYAYFMSNLLMPEIMYAGITAVFISLNTRSSRKSSRSRELLSFCLATAAFGLRTIGVALYAAWVGEAILKRDLRQAFMRLTLSAIAIGAWQTYVRYVEAREDYLVPVYEYQRAPYLFYNVSYFRNVLLSDPFSQSARVNATDLLKRIGGNVRRLPVALAEAATAERHIWLPVWTGQYTRKWPRALDLALGTLGLAIVAGLIIQVAQGYFVVPLYVAATIIMVCTVPWPVQLPRYLWPLTPFLLTGLIFFLLRVQERLQVVLLRMPRYTRYLTVSVPLTCLLTQQATVFYRAHTSWLVDAVYRDQAGATIRQRVFGYFPSDLAIDQASDWLGQHAQAGEVVATSSPPLVFLRTGLKSVMPPFETNPERAQTLLDQVPVTFLFLETSSRNINGRSTSEWVAPVVEMYPSNWNQVYASSDGMLKIYRRVHLARE